MKGLINTIILSILPLVGYSAALEVHLTQHNEVPLAGAAIYLHSVTPAEDPDLTRQPVEIQQKDKRFVPYISVMQANSRVIFSNRDDITHHVYSLTGSTRFEFKLRVNEENSAQTFKEPGIFSMGCNIHDWMSGYLLVVNTPHYALTDDKGFTTFAVPAGEYTVTAWHPQMREESPSVTVTIPGTPRVELQLKKKMANIPQQKSLDNFDFLDGY